VNRLKASSEAEPLNPNLINRARKITNHAMFEDDSQRVEMEFCDRPEPEDEFRKNLQHCYDLFENAHDLIYVHDLNGRYTAVNKTGARLVGYSREEILRLHISDFVAPEYMNEVREQLRQKLRSPEQTTYEIEVIARSGQRIPIEVNSQLIFEDGRPVAVQGIARDITERKRNEKALRESEERFRALFENANDIIFTCDRAGTFTSLNLAGEKLTGYDRKEAFAMNFAQVVAPEYLDLAREMFSRKAVDDIVTVYELEIITKSGDRAALEVSSRALRSEGLLAGIQGIARDITERKAAELRLTESETRLRAILDSEPECVKLLDANSMLLEMNRAGLAMIEADSLVQLDGKSVIGIVEPGYRRAFQQLTAEVFQGRSGTLEFEIRGLKGTHRWLETHAGPLRDKDGIVTALLSITRDITERKRMEGERQALFEIIQGVSTSANLEALLKLIHRSIGEVLYAENCFVALCDESDAMLSMQFFIDKYDSAPPRQMHGKSCAAHVFSTGKPLLITSEIFDQMRAAGEVELIGEPSPSWLGVPLNTPSRTIGVLVVQHYEDEQAYSERDVEFLSSVGNQIAIAIERKKSESAMNRLAAAVEQTADSVMITDIEGNIQYVNPAFERITGYSKQEALGQNARILKSRKTDASVHRELWETISNGAIWVGQLTNKRKNGTLYEERATISPVRDDSGQIVNYIAVKQDTTTQTQLEAQLRQAQKMEAIGQLAGGVAHDFNNLLTVILGYSDLSLERSDSKDSIGRNLGEIKKAAERAASLTRQLLAFSRKQILDERVLDLNVVVSDMYKMLRRLIGEDIVLVTALASDLGKVKADPGQVEQIIMNLTVNARDAMPDGGNVTIDTTNVRLTNEYAQEHLPVQPGEYVRLAISDNGTGMDAETQQRIFEPFFTTKELGKGTGLGLSTVYGIVKQTGGFIWVYSEVGKGTTFKIYLPRVDDGEQECKRSSGPKESFQGSETILVVEDEDMVRRLAREVLEMNGYHVLEAANGPAAITVCKEYEQPIQLLLTDVVMPEMSGRELAGHLARLRPEIKVLYMSGYTNDAIVHHGMLDAGISFLQKPFAPNAIARKVREVLSSRRKSDDECSTG
jgi:two-component system, cell cycle sensor histidine kinase and response regulator CckA